jgi:hypothetical protein
MKTIIDGIEHPIPAPHCDPRVLHAPGVCRYCDDEKHDRWRKYRKTNKILFTGELPRDGWSQCPAEAARGLDVLNRWPGNEPADAFYDAARAAELEVLKKRKPRKP